MYDFNQNSHDDEDPEEIFKEVEEQDLEETEVRK